MDITIDVKDYKLNVKATCIIIHNNKVLFHKAMNTNHYSLLGGRVKIGENTEETIKREVKEELGKEIEIIGYAATIENFFVMKGKKYHEYMFIYQAEFKEEKDKKIQETMKNVEGKENLQYVWIDLEKIDEYNIKPQVAKEIIKQQKYPTHKINDDLGNKFKEVNRISILGGPGTGKSTLAKNLGRELELPVCHIDSIHHLENWKIRDKKERDNIILEKIEEKKWIFDGTYKETLEERINASDLIIFLDYSTLAKLKGVLSRYFKNRGKEMAEIPGCIEKMDMCIIKAALKWNKYKRCNVIRALENNKDKEVIIFKNRRQLNKWYENEFKKKIEKE